MRASLPAFALLLALLAGAAPAQEPTAEPIEPRAFGYQVGDVLQRRVRLQWPAGLAPDLASLPQARRPGQALELRALRLVGHELLLDYQVFLAPSEVRTLEIAPLQLRFAGPAGERFLRIDAWPVTVAPLLPLEVSPRQGLGDLRPDAPPPAIPTAARLQRLALVGAALAVIALGLLHLWVGLPWWGRRQRPFARAWRALQALPSAATPAQWRAALQALHQALNASAGRVLLQADLPAFVAAHPRFAPQQPALAEFFERSRDEFFAGRAPRPDPPWLRALCRACRDAERGGA